VTFVVVALIVPLHFVGALGSELVFPAFLADPLILARLAVVHFVMALVRRVPLALGLCDTRYREQARKREGQTQAFHWHDILSLAEALVGRRPCRGSVLITVMAK
jgi:hypothetical protein